MRSLHKTLVIRIVIEGSTWILELLELPSFRFGVFFAAVDLDEKVTIIGIYGTCLDFNFQIYDQSLSYTGRLTMILRTKYGHIFYMR